MTLSQLRNFYALALLAAACGGTSASAASITLTLEYLQSYDSSFNPIGVPLVVNPFAVLPTDYHQFDVSFAIADAAANEDLQIMQFDVELGPGISPADFGGYIADSPSYDPPGPFPIAPVFPINTDAGPDPNDFVRITAIAQSNPIYVHGFRPGIVGTGRIGDIYVQYDISQLTFDSTLTVVPNSPNPWFTYVGTTPVAHPVESFHFGGIIWPPPPEEALITVLGNDIVIANGDVTPDAADFTDWGEVNPFSTRTYTLECTGLCPISLDDPIITGPYELVGGFPDLVNDSASFTLQLQALAPGQYPGSISFGHDGSNASPYTFAITARVIPEPASGALMGLLLVGWYAYSRGPRVPSERESSV